MTQAYPLQWPDFILRSSRHDGGHGTDKVLAGEWTGEQRPPAIMSENRTVMVAKWRWPDNICQQVALCRTCDPCLMLDWNGGEFLVSGFDDLAIIIHSIISDKIRPAPDYWNDGQQGLVGIEEAVSEIVSKMADIRSSALEEGARMVRKQIAQSHLLMSRKHQDAAADALQGSRFAFHEEDRDTWKKLEKKSLILAEYHSQSARALLVTPVASDESQAVLARPITTGRG